MTLSYVVNHVFLPPKLPQHDDSDPEEYISLATKVSDAAMAYVKQLPGRKKSMWDPILGMLSMLSESPVPSEEDINNAMMNMMNGDIMALLIRAQNAGIIIRRGKSSTVFETFEASAPCAVVMSTKGKLLCSFPGPAVQIPNYVSDDPTFQSEFSSFLAHMDVDELDSAATAKKAGSVTVEQRDSAHPRYITQLLSEILRGMGEAANTTRIQKRIADDVLWNNAYLPWRRSPLWLVIRVALQTTLSSYRDSDGHAEYKAFMVFFMSQILRNAVEEKLSNDLLSCMRAKLGRRLYKIRSTVPNFVIQDVEDVVKETEELLKTRWNRVQAQQSFSRRWRPQDLDFERDTRLSLHNSKAYISQILKGDSRPQAPFKFKQKHEPRCHGFSPKALKKAFVADPSVALADFELTVQNKIDEWVSLNLSNEAAVVDVATCILHYSEAAQKLYADNPEDMSIMFLTLFELWVALDKMAVDQCPLLSEYSPEIPLELLYALIIRTSQSIHRLNIIETYLRHRYDAASHGSAFTDGASPNTFAVRYFNQSPKLEALRDLIEQEAEVQRKIKLDELEEKNAQHRSLQEQSGCMNHNQQYDAISAKFVHSKNCSKCLLEKQAQGLKISVHEWPLPRTEPQAMTVVFELDPPIVFSVWRTSTFWLLHEICTPVSDRPTFVAEPKGTLENYTGLRKYVVRNVVTRIALASPTKSFQKSHYRTVRIPSKTTNVLLNNGLTFNLFFPDGSRSKGRWVGSSPFSSCNISEKCTFRLPKHGPYSKLQYAIAGTSHTSNSVIASQSECPKTLNIHAYIAFATLRAGGRIQWMNIARELSARTLSFNREEVHLLLLQAIWNIGPLSSTDYENREWHGELKIPEFSLMLLSEMEKFLVSVEANWLECISACTIIVMAGRILTSAINPQVFGKGYMLLRKARSVTFGWMRSLVAKLQEVNDEITMQDYRLRVCEIAATCRGTYDVDSKYAPMLLYSAEDVAIFMECAFVIHENTPPNVDRVPIELKRLLDRDRRLSHALNSPLCNRISKDCSGLNRAISSIWTAYRPGPTWEMLRKPNDRWITSQTACGFSQMSQRLHLNTMNGRLLVEGKPLGQLPREITSKSLYSRIFGQIVLDVIPSDLPGMDFSSRGSISGHQVFFSLRNNKELVIRAISGTTVHEIIPQEKLAGDFPQLLVDDYVHWLDVSQGTLEFRPLESRWAASEKNWSMNFSQDDSRMKRIDSGRLVDIRSASFCSISACIKALEDEKFLTITYSKDHTIQVDLPRFRLSFVLKDKFLESVNFPGMIIDDNQSTGTMYGLQNQLVLCPKEPDIKPRHVLIPRGSICIKDDGDHVRITIDTSAQPQVSYLDYTINVDLGCLVGNGSLMSNYYKTYLHAITSFCLSDPLTGRTGTEEALYGINSANHRSFQRLAVEEIDLLKEIGSLTPVRTFYPVHRKVMQQVEWNALAPSAQHYGFHTAIESIMEYANRLQFIRGEPEYEGYKSPSDPNLLERAARRNAIFNTHDEVACTSFSDACDVRHTSRDQEVESEAVVANTSALVHSWPSNPPRICHQLFDVLKSWEKLAGPNAKLSLSYSRQWIDPNLPDIWISLYNACRRSKKDDDLYRIAFTFSTMAYTSPSSRDLIPTLLSFATMAEFGSEHPPRWSSYDLSNGTEPRKDQLVSLISSSVLSLYENEEDWESLELMLVPRRIDLTGQSIKSRATRVAQKLIDQWPCKEPNFQSVLKNDIFDLSTLVKKLKPLFESWYHNMELYRHISDVQELLDDLLEDPQRTVQAYSFIPFASDQSKAVFQTVRFAHLLEHGTPSFSSLPNMFGSPDPGSLQTSKTSPGSEDMKSIISEFRNSSTPFRRIYGDHMMRSFESLTSQQNSFVLPGNRSQPIQYIQGLVRYRDLCKDYSRKIFDQICNTLGPSTQVETIMYSVGLWPRITRVFLLRCLSVTTTIELPEKWKLVVNFYAQSLIQLQRSRRLISFALLGNNLDFFSELSNTGPVAQETPDWLLIQLDSNFFVRPVQTAVTQEMIAPSSGQNTVLQLNMGEGKSSVVVPMAAAALAEGSNLVRVVVLKQLASQMFQLLVSRLSGLSSRRIYYLPLSRSLEIDAKKAQCIQDIFQECARTGGIMVVQPEHILSFKLMGIDRSLRSTTNVERGVVGKLLESQRWLDEYSRDILDESDEILQVRYQLIYTVGLQAPLEGHPDRWTTIQQCLALLRKHVQTVKGFFPLGIEIMERGIGCFPQVRVIQDDAASLLISLVSNDVIAGKITNLSLDRFSKQNSAVASYFIACQYLPSSQIKKLEELCGVSSPLWKGLLLLRGLFGHGILKYVLTAKRWRVDYGLDPRRSLLAVPYRAKDVPALRAEFGHPDVCIVLTCFSYYYGGLTDDQLYQCIELLFKLDNPPLEYDNWIRDITVPDVLRQVSGINIKDIGQRNQYLIPLFRYNHAVIDFYLSQFVFPKEAKQFPQKLTTSGWDIAECKSQVTTGFSGTNDNRYLLPTSIAQLDDPRQESTNAKVLVHLLQPENDYYCSIPQGERPSAQGYLDLLIHRDMDIRVLLDIGAQMVDLSNTQVATEWLSSRPKLSAVVLFNENDELVVITSDGREESFISSPYNQQLEKCLVYLDDVHTRGTDLKLPSDFRAAVTLGPEVTKDRLVQGCMRMRRLGHGQSVMFMAPPEVDRKIRKSASKGKVDQVHVKDIIRWVMQETCTDILYHVPHWANQGLDHYRRKEAWAQVSSSSSSEKLASTWLQPESKSLEKMYGLSSTDETTFTKSVFEIPALKRRCEDLGITHLQDVRMEEEQEREVSHEVEVERDIERPAKAKPADSSVHKDVRKFVRFGVIPHQSPAFVPLFSGAGNSILGKTVWSPNLLATKDFSTTVIRGPHDNVGDYLRPVHWIVSTSGQSDRDVKLVAFSPEEVNELLPEIRKSQVLHLHVYAPRVTQTMRSFEDLNFYAVPPLPLVGLCYAPEDTVLQTLNLWSGQLYLRDYETYLRLCQFLGLYSPEVSKKQDYVRMQSDGFILKADRPAGMYLSCALTESPIPVLNEIIGLRRKGIGYLPTHLGRILQAKSLAPEDFES